KRNRETHEKTGKFWSAQAARGQAPGEHARIEVAAAAARTCLAEQRHSAFRAARVNQYCTSHSPMNHLRIDQLPFEGMSHEFVGEKHSAPISIYFVDSPPGRGPV